MSASPLTAANDRSYWTRFDSFLSLPLPAFNFDDLQGQALFDGWGKEDTDGLNRLISMLLDSIETRADDVANWPNVSFRSPPDADHEFKAAGAQPFSGVKSNTYVDTNSTWLELIDGGLNLENVPLGPLLVKARDVDFIVAADGR